MNFVQFCQAHGLVMDSLPNPGVWARFPTTDHPRKKNGAAKYMGDFGVCQNHATMVDVAVWRPDADAKPADMRAINAKVAQQDRKMREGWRRAADKADQMIRSAKQDTHAYLEFKGFKETQGLTIDDALIVPMRNLIDNGLMGAQVIKWLPDVMAYEKKMLPGMRAKGAVFRLGGRSAASTWLVEGYATGLTVEAALRLLRLNHAVLICFSAGNLIHVASQLKGRGYVFADNDASGAGERSAQQTGLPYCMAGIEGYDANDLHADEGILRVASLMLDATQVQPP